MRGRPVFWNLVFQAEDHGIMSVNITLLLLSQAMSGWIFDCTGARLAIDGFSLYHLNS